jgi:hypothetical protein
MRAKAKIEVDADAKLFATSCFPSLLLRCANVARAISWPLLAAKKA